MNSAGIVSFTPAGESVPVTVQVVPGRGVDVDAAVGWLLAGLPPGAAVSRVEVQEETVRPHRAVVDDV